MSAKWDEEYDIVILGAGAGGMTAALVSAIEGLRVLLIEKSDQIGGTTARSSGTVWVPDNHHQRRLGILDDAALALTYLDALVGSRTDRALREAFIAAGPQMIKYLERHTDVHFQPYPHQPDYRQDLPGAATGNRPLEPLPFDGRALGEHFDLVRSPIPELMLFGGMMVTRGEAARLTHIATSFGALAFGVKLTARYIADRMRYHRGTRLVLGNALSARLFKNLIDRGVPVWVKTKTVQLMKEAGRVTGLVVEQGDEQLKIRVHRGVVLAGGGFPASRKLRQRYFPKPIAAYTTAFEGCVGDTLQLAQDIGASLGEEGEDNALWFPSSIAIRRDGSTAVYPHIVLDRAKPGLIAVNSAGRRFVNEAVSYHEFTRGMYRTHGHTPCIPAMLVCDRRFLGKYGLGMIRPFTPILKPFIKSGYLGVANTLEELAQKIHVNPSGLVSTVNKHNGYAKTGIDEEFGKGGNTYDLSSGDPTHRPNPCLGPIKKPPFFSVAVVPTPLGTSLGLRSNVNGQVCDRSNHPIPGLFTCGNDMHSVMGGEYPGAGVQLGLAMTFGYVIAKHAAREA